METASGDGETGWAAGVPPRPLGDSKLQSQTLESLGAAVHYHRWLTGLAAPYLGDHPLELGSGLGDYAQAWLDQGVPKIAVSEVDPFRLTHLRDRFSTDGRVQVLSFDVQDPPSASHSAFVAFNVLEHISDHVGALNAAHTLVRPGGTVVIFVPAFQFALGRFDRQVGHVRRYTAGTIRLAMQQAGLDVEIVQYVNMPGLPAWFVGMKLLRMTPQEGRLLKMWDEQVIPRARRWEQKHRVPFGQSVFAVARVPRKPSWSMDAPVADRTPAHTEAPDER